MRDSMPFINASGETVPGGAFMRVTDTDSEGRYVVAKPDTDDVMTCVVNGPVSVEDGSGGNCHSALELVAAYDQGGDQPAAGEEWGVAAGSWYLTKDRKGYRVSGGAGGGFVNVLRGGAATSEQSPNSWKNWVKAASVSSLSDPTSVIVGASIDGVTLAAGDDFLAKDEATSSRKGIYTVLPGSAGSFRRADADGVNELVGATVYVSNGTVNGKTVWQCETVPTITPGTTATVWRKIFPLTLASGTSTISGGIAVGYNFATGGFQDTGLQLTLPEAGTYTVIFTGGFWVDPSSFGSGSAGYAQVKLRDTTNSVDVPGAHAFAQGLVLGTKTPTYPTLHARYTVTGSTVVKMQFSATTSGGETYNSISFGASGFSHNAAAQYFRTDPVKG